MPVALNISVLDAADKPRRAEQLLSKLEHLARDLHGRSGEKALADIWSLASACLDTEIAAIVKSSGRWKRLQRVIGRGWATHVQREEIRAVHATLDSGVLSASVLALEGYESLDNELRLAPRLGDCRTVIMAGGGAYPETLMHVLARLTAARAISLDANAHCLTLCDKFLRKARPELHTRMELVLADAREFSFHEADVVILANGLEHKQEVLWQVLRTCPPRASALVRVPLLLGELFYESVSAGGCTNDQRTSVLARTLLFDGGTTKPHAP